MNKNSFHDYRFHIKLHIPKHPVEKNYFLALKTSSFSKISVSLFQLEGESIVIKFSYVNF